jgi:acetyltransferase-like isoleucine patch superfamily enzyme
MVLEIFQTPWKIWNSFWRWINYPFVRILFLSNKITWGHDWRFYGCPIIQKHRLSKMQFGSGLSLRSSVRSNPLGASHPVILSTWKPDATLAIGDNFAMTGGTICAAEKIIIGNNVAIGANSTIVDTDFHPLNSEYRRLHPQEASTAPVNIEDDVFIGMNCLILKGVTIGCGTVIGAGSVIAHDIPPHVIAAGNPVKVLKEL